MNARISVAMIVKNEERYLRGCLESVAPWADEIVIVDTGSTDTTMDIAREFTDRIHPFVWAGDFSAARNEAIRHCTGDWILSIDADERLLDGAALRVLTTDRNSWAFSLLIRGKHHLPTGFVDQVNAFPRFFRHHPKVRFEGVVHEQVLPSLLRLGKPVRPSSVVIEHLGYAESLEKVQHKCRRNIALLEEHLRRHPRDTYALYQLGNTHVVLQEYPAAEAALNAVLTAGADRSIVASANNLLVEAALSRNAVEEAERYCRQSLNAVPEQTMARWFLTGILAHCGCFEESLMMLKGLRRDLGKGPSPVLSHDLVLDLQQVEERMLVCYDHLTGPSAAGAAEWMRDAEREEVRSFALVRRGLDLAMASKDVPTAVRRIQTIVELLPEDAGEQKERFLAIKQRLEGSLAQAG